MAKRRSLKIGVLILHIILIGTAIVYLAPILWTISTSLKPEGTVIRYPIEWIPNPLTFENYRYILSNPRIPIIRWFFNSIFVAVVTTLLTLVVTSFAAYPFARMQFPGRDVIFAMVISTLMIPYPVTMVPLYILFDKLNWIDGYLSLIVPPVTSAFGVFLLRQFFLTIPTDLEDAARIDGLGRFGILCYIILPLSKPALMALVIFTFLRSWNAFTWPLIVIDSLRMRTLPIGLAIFQNEYLTQYALVMAAAVIASSPLLLVFALLQRYFIKGITFTGLKV